MRPRLFFGLPYWLRAVCGGIHFGLCASPTGCSLKNVNLGTGRDPFGGEDVRRSCRYAVETIRACRCLAQVSLRNVVIRPSRNAFPIPLVYEGLCRNEPSDSR